MNKVKNCWGHPFYQFCRNSVIVVSRIFFRLHVIGLEKVPHTGSLIVCCNHIHNFDPPVLGSVIPRYVHFMTKSELFKVKVVSRLLLVIGAFPVNRGGQDKSAIKYALSVPKSGECLVIFPEGHRSKGGKLGQGQPGVAFIARKSGSPVVPAAIIGPYRLFGRLTIRFGNLIQVNEKDTNEQVLDTLMTAIKKLVDEGHSK